MAFRPIFSHRHPTVHQSRWWRGNCLVCSRFADARGRACGRSPEVSQMSNKNYDFMIQELFTVFQLAEFLKKKPSTIYSDSIRRPECLPPILRVPGSSKILFINPRQWAASFIQLAKVVKPAESEMPTKRRRGAPTKAERIALQKVVGSQK